MDCKTPSMNKSRSSYQKGFVVCTLFLVLDVWMLVSGTTRDRVAAWGGMFLFALFAAAFALPAFGLLPPKKVFYAGIASSRHVSPGGPLLWR